MSDAGQTPEEPPGPNPAGDSLPAHRIVGRALVLTLCGAPCMAAAILFGFTLANTFRSKLVPMFFAISLVFCAFLSLSTGLARNVRRSLRPLILLVCGVTVTLVVALGYSWFEGILRGGPSAAWSHVAHFVRRLFHNPTEEAAFTIATAIPFSLLGVVQSRALPQILLRFADRIWLHLLTGVIGGMGFLAYDLINRWEDEAPALWLCGAIGCAFGMWLGERLDGLLVRHWRRRIEASA